MRGSNALPAGLAPDWAAAALAAALVAGEEAGELGLNCLAW
jgi:hypothetical protein